MKLAIWSRDPPTMTLDLDRAGKVVPNHRTRVSRYSQSRLASEDSDLLASSLSDLFWLEIRPWIDFSGEGKEA